MGRIIRSGQARRRDAAGDLGFTLVEVILAIAILTVAIAATTAAISLAASARRDGGVQVTAAEIANEALQQAEAFGCGLPPDFNGVSAADRLARCDYNGTETGGAGLADVDFTTVRNGHSFDVEVRMRWFSLDLPPHHNFFPTFSNQCQRQVFWVDGLLAGRGTQYPTDAVDPTLLRRTVTVTSPNGRVVTVESTETVRPELADPHRSGFVFTTIEVNQPVHLTQTRSGVDQWTMEFHSDDEECLWIPYLEYGGVGYYTDSWISGIPIARKNHSPCDDDNNSWATSNICHEQTSP